MNLCFTEAIKDYPGYLITRDGRVLSIQRKIMRSHGKPLFIKGRIRKLQKAAYGYLAILLTNEDGKRKNKKIHILVANAFIPNPLSLPEVNHKDGNKTNNNVENLEWVTSSENKYHAYNVLNRPRRGSYSH